MKDFAWVLGRIRDLCLRHGGAAVYFRRATWPAPLAVCLCGKVVTLTLEGWVDLSEAQFFEGKREEREAFYPYNTPLVSWKPERVWAPTWADLLANDWEVAK